VLTVKVLKEGVHSGDSSGIVPDSFRIARNLLSRVEDPYTGEIINDFQVTIPPHRYQQLVDTATSVKSGINRRFPLLDKMDPANLDPVKAYIASTWEA